MFSLILAGYHRDPFAEVWLREAKGANGHAANVSCVDGWEELRDGQEEGLLGMDHQPI